MFFSGYFTTFQNLISKLWQKYWCNGMQFTCALPSFKYWMIECWVSQNKSTIPQVSQEMLPLLWSMSCG